MPDQWTPKLDAYLDGELSAAEMLALDAHVRACPACAAEVLARLQLKRAVQAGGRRFTPRPEFRTRMQRQIGGRPRPVTSQMWAAFVAVMAILLVAALVATHVGRVRSERGHNFGEIADLHVAALASSSPVDVISTDRHTVKPWFAGKIPFTFSLPDLQNTGFTLLGGRVTYLGQAPGAQLIYQVRQHRISVFIFQDRDLDRLGQDSAPQTQLSFHLQTWSHGDLRYFVIGDAASQDISQLSKLFQSAD